MNRLGQRIQTRRRRARGLLSSGWIDVVLEPLERRIVASVAMGSSALTLDWYQPGPVAEGVEHTTTNLDGSEDATDGLVGDYTRVNADHKKAFTEELASVKDDRNGTAADFVATIDWGDGATSAGEIIANRKGGFDVVGTHTYNFGWHTPKITITDLRDASRSSVVESAVYVIPPPVAGRGTTIEAVGGHEFRGVVATFVGLDTDLLEQYSAYVSWNDGGWSNETPTLKVLENGVVQVIASHTFRKPGVFDVNVTLSERHAPPPWRYSWRDGKQIVVQPPTSRASGAGAVGRRKRAAARW